MPVREKGQKTATAQVRLRASRSEVSCDRHCPWPVRYEEDIRVRCIIGRVGRIAGNAFTSDQGRGLPDEGTRNGGTK